MAFTQEAFEDDTKQENDVVTLSVIKSQLMICKNRA